MKIGGDEGQVYENENLECRRAIMKQLMSYKER